MINRHIILWLSVVWLPLASLSLYASESSVKPVTPNASPQAQALLQLLYNISGRYILTGQHNYPNTKDVCTQRATTYSGKVPAVYSQDWGFAQDGDKDSYLARPDIVREVKRQHALGSLITLCWHAVPPTADEPVTFRRKQGEAPPEKLNTVQGRLTDEQFLDVLTPGTELHTRWCAQVDTVAVYLRQLQDANIPILWRPYHEMNGDWFWWGGRRGQHGTAALYRQLFDRYVHHHRLNNLIWVWSVDRPTRPERRFADYFPGSNYLDVLSLDVYGNDFNETYYEGLLSLSQGKPLILGEVGNPPSLEVLHQQPRWSLYVIWAGMFRWIEQESLQALVNDPRVLSLNDPAYHQVLATFRTVCGLPPLQQVQTQTMQ